jgi:hypothetical protein
LDLLDAFRHVVGFVIDVHPKLLECLYHHFGLLGLSGLGTRGTVRKAISVYVFRDLGENTRTIKEQERGKT